MKRKNGMFGYPEVGVPFLWPFSLFDRYRVDSLKTFKDNIRFLNEVKRTQVDRPAPVWATENKVIGDLSTVRLRDFSCAERGIYTLVVAPYAGHTSVIVDFQSGQSLVRTLRSNGLHRVCATDWKEATIDMKDYSIDIYLNELNTCVDDLGGLVNLAGLCQGGWLSAMYAARFPQKVNSLVLAGAPIDTDAGECMVKKFAHRLPMGFFEGLVAAGGGLLKGGFMLGGFKSLHPKRHYFEKFVELYEHIDDPSYVRRFRNFERWYEHTIDLPGRFYLQVIRELFKENKFFKGRFIGLGKRLDLEDIDCPVYLLGGEDDDITPMEQVFNTAKRLGTRKRDIRAGTARGGHIGLFMGSMALRENWPDVARWIDARSR